MCFGSGDSVDFCFGTCFRLSASHFCLFSTPDGHATRNCHHCKKKFDCRHGISIASVGPVHFTKSAQNISSTTLIYESDGTSDHKLTNEPIFCQTLFKMFSLQPATSVPIPVCAESPDTWASLEKAETQTQTHRPRAAVPSVPAALFTPKIHPQVAEVTAEVDAFFLKHWPFESDKARKKFVAAGFSAVTCLYFPEALDERIAFACRLLALLFLVDGEYNLPIDRVRLEQLDLT